MNVSEALDARHCVRAFQPDPIAPEVLTSLLASALRAPSWANTQPWELYVAVGEPLERIRAAYGEGFRERVERSSDLPRPQEWPEEMTRRMNELRDERDQWLASQGPADPEAGDMRSLNNELFRAPALIYVCMDKSLTPWSVFDLGILSQSIMLAALDHGLGTMPAYNLVVFPGMLRRELEIPDSLSIIMGIALGREDETHPLNRFHSSRRPVEDVATIKGL